MTRYMTRRRFLGASTAAAALVTVPTVASASDPGTWSTVETPTSNTLYDVAYAADGAYAVGGGGSLLRRTESGWEMVTKNGPRGNGSDLYGIDATTDGERLWFVGASGAIGEYDAQRGNITDHSQPNDASGDFNDVAASGGSCSTVFVGDDSGAIHYSFADGDDGTWNAVTPGSGAATRALDLYGGRSGHAIDDNQSVFHTRDGESWTKVGVEDADDSFLGVDCRSADDVTISASGGALYSYDGSQWRRTQVHAVDLRAIQEDAEAGLTVGETGTVLRRSGGSWSQEPTDTGENLEGVSQVGRSPEIAVGSGGTVLEH